MTQTAPITQDVLTIPRKAPEAERVNIVGLTREGLRDALIAAGTPERQAKMRVGQIWQWVYQWGVRDFAEMTNLAKAYRADLAERFVIEIPEMVSRSGERGRDAQVPRAHQWRARGRGGLHPRDRSRDAVHLVPGGLHADLLVLSHGHAEAGAQPHRGRDHRAGDAGARRSRRVAETRRGGGRAAAAHLQHRADGDGRAALQFRERARRDEDRDGWRGHLAEPPADHAVDLRDRAGDRADGRRDRLSARRELSRDDRRGARPAGADQPQVEHRDAAGRPAGVSAAVELGADHVRIRDAQGGQ